VSSGAFVGETCPVCGSPPADRCFVRSPDRSGTVRGTFSVAVCSSCGGGWTLPAASAADLASFYPDTYQAYVLQRGLLGAVQRLGQRLLFARSLSTAPLRELTRMPVGSVLDVGCGRGDLGEALVRRGWRVAGVDPSPSACAAAKARGVDARVGTLESVHFEPGSFDAVVMTHALEHVLDPRADLRRIRGLLRTGGVVVISVPNFGSWQRARFDGTWFPLELPRHRTHFTRASLARALTNEGFELLAVGPASDNGFALLATIQYAVAGRLVLERPPAAWLGYAVWPFSRLIDRVGGEGALLHAVAQRPVTD
jgi:SAM-dependent methyltransferase